MIVLLEREEDDFLERLAALDHVLPLAVDAAHADEVFEGTDVQEDLLEELGGCEDLIGGLLRPDGSCLSDTCGATLNVLVGVMEVGVLEVHVVEVGVLEVGVLEVHVS